MALTAALALLTVGAAADSPFGFGGPATPQEIAGQNTEDVIMIGQLNGRYALALDGLVPDAASAWAQTFVERGKMAILDSDGTVVAEATGQSALVAMYNRFPDIDVTRHWFNNLVITTAGSTATMTSYCVALRIKTVPALIERTGVYRDRLVKQGGAWKFEERILTLDAASGIVMGAAHE